MQVVSSRIGESRACIRSTLRTFFNFNFFIMHCVAANFCWLAEAVFSVVFIMGKAGGYVYETHEPALTGERRAREGHETPRGSEHGRRQQMETTRELFFFFSSLLRV